MIFILVTKNATHFQRRTSCVSASYWMCAVKCQMEIRNQVNFKAVLVMHASHVFHLRLHSASIFFFSFYLMNIFRTEIILFIHIFLYFLLATSLASLYQFFIVKVLVGTSNSSKFQLAIKFILLHFLFWCNECILNSLHLFLQ